MFGMQVHMFEKTKLFFTHGEYAGKAFWLKAETM